MGKVGMIFWAVALLLLGLAAYVRLAPSDPARWHVAPPDLAVADCSVIRGEGDARAACRIDDTAEGALARLDAIATASPRTRRLDGSAASGRITWITRSALWGFPDYTTAAARPDGDGAIVTIHARLRFGRSDMGVNAARLTDWLGQLNSP